MVEHFYDNFGDLQKTDRQTDKRWWNLYPPRLLLLWVKNFPFQLWSWDKSSVTTKLTWIWNCIESC